VEKIGSVEIVLATDVDNPLTGPQGATEMYGPQKGATPEDVRELEGALVEYEVALVAASAPGVALGAGSGAAGGLGAALLALGATRRSGIEEVARHVDLPSSVAWADLVVTGEGSFDWQSLRGKVVSGVAFHATRLGKPTIVLAGQVHCGRREYTSIGIESAYAMAETPEQVAESMARPHLALAALAERVSRTWSA
jgi:glycerate 2-kinase